ncbi:MAG: hypothetical protein WD934_10180 [Gemmatimonadales bacterium]
MSVRTWVLARRRALGGWAVAAAFLSGLGLAAFGLAVGLWLGRAEVYRAAPALVVLGWALALAGLGLAYAWGRRLWHALAPERLATAVETTGGLRDGRVGAFATGQLRGSPTLAEYADREVSGWLVAHGAGALRPTVRRLHRQTSVAAMVFVAGVVTFAMGGPGVSDGRAAFWQPVRTIARARGPVTLDADRLVVRRGDTVAIVVTAEGRRRAAVSLRAPGEPWRDTTLLLDTAGQALLTLGPLADDRYVRALRGSTTSDSLHVRVTIPAFLADFQVVARFPGYLERGEEPVVPSGDPVSLPVGTRLTVRGQATVPLRQAALVDGQGRRHDLTVRGRELTGELVVTRDEVWTLEPATRDGAALEPPLPMLAITAVPDSAPIITIPIPGADTTASTSLRQALVLDVRDDHRVRRVEILSRRVSRLGVEGPVRVDTVPMPPEGLERAVLPWTLDATARGLLPGDTLYYRGRAVDNAPKANVSTTREYRLRLPALDELRAEARAEVARLAAAADALARAQRALGRQTEDLAAQRARTERADGQPDERLGYEQAQRAGEVSAEQERMMQRAEELRQRVRDLQEAARDAGITDPEWQRQLRELERLLQRAVTPEMQEALDALREAMERLDAPAMQEALQRLAEAQRQMREDLERSRELFERAALEGQMSALAEDAEQLAAEQQRWADQAASRADSAMATVEQRLQAQTQGLAEALEGVAQGMRDSSTQAMLSQQAQQAQQAAQQMQQAAQAAEQGQRQQAQQAGQQASQTLSQMPEALRRSRDALRARWRREVLDQLDRALIEIADLARRQERVSERIARGDVGPDTRGMQAAVRDGVDRVVQRLQNAAGQNALVSPQLTRALGFARLNMTRGVEVLQQATPNTRQAIGFAGQALDGLNVVAHQLIRSRGAVEGAQTGSGLQEAIEQMAQMARQQHAMAGQAGGLLPMMPSAGDMIMQELQRLSQEQRQLAQELDRLRAAQGRDGLDPLAQEAREIAAQLEAGVLDRQTVERQEQLYRRLLDQGRTLQGEEPDEERERESRTARPGERFVPPAARRDDGPRYPYPGWEALQRLAPETRRAVLEYFRRLNEPRP